MIKAKAKTSDDEVLVISDSAPRGIIYLGESSEGGFYTLVRDPTLVAKKSFDAARSSRSVFVSSPSLFSPQTQPKRQPKGKDLAEPADSRSQEDHSRKWNGP